MVEQFEKEVREALRKELIEKNKNKNALARWERYRLLKDSTLPDPADIISDIEKIAKFNLKLAAVIALLLLTGSRIQEVTKYKYRWVKNCLVNDITGTKLPLTYEKYKELKDITGESITKPAIRRGDIQTKEIEGEMWIIIRTRVEKYHDVQNTHYKYAWLRWNDEEYYFPLLKIVDEYLDEFSNENKSVELFTFTHNHVREKLAQYLGLTPHILRNYSAKYLVQYKHFTVQDLMRWFKWKSAEQAIAYSSSDDVVIRNRMMGIDLGEK